MYKETEKKDKGSKSNGIFDLPNDILDLLKRTSSPNNVVDEGSTENSNQNNLPFNNIGRVAKELSNNNELAKKQELSYMGRPLQKADFKEWLDNVAPNLVAGEKKAVIIKRFRDYLLSNGHLVNPSRADILDYSAQTMNYEEGRLYFNAFKDFFGWTYANTIFPDLSKGLSRNQLTIAKRNLVNGNK